MEPTPSAASSKLCFRLSVEDHRRDIAGMTYVYPVVSRRAGGVSVGINLNPNNACNWRCIYCQVPELARGSAPPIDLTLLERELATLLSEILHGCFLAEHVPERFRRLRDIALSGNGEPTTSRQFAEVIEIVARVIAEMGLGKQVKVVVITNGSLADKRWVRPGLARLGALGGELWFKVDAATSEGLRAINGTRVQPEAHARRLEIATALCPTWIQTCVFALDGQSWDAQARAAYLAFLARARAFPKPPRGVLLYGLARPSMQPEASRLARLPRAWLEALAADIRALGLETRISP